MSSRFRPHDPSHNAARSSLFDNYTGDKSSRTNSQSPARFGTGPASSTAGGGGGYGYPGDAGGYGAQGFSEGFRDEGFRPATPNRRGQYSDAVLSELESQNDEQMEGMSARVKMLKDLTSAIGDEIRDSTSLAEKMNDSFEGTRVRLRGTMNRMLRMAERTGVGWRAWLGFFAAVAVLFWYVWLF